MARVSRNFFGWSCAWSPHPLGLKGSRGDSGHLPQACPSSQTPGPSQNLICVAHMGAEAQCSEGHLENLEGRSRAGWLSRRAGAMLGSLHPDIGRTGVGCASPCAKCGASTRENHTRSLKAYPGGMPRWGTGGGEAASAWGS